MTLLILDERAWCSCAQEGTPPHPSAAGQQTQLKCMAMDQGEVATHRILLTYCVRHIAAFTPSNSSTAIMYLSISKRRRYTTAKASSCAC
jgi:hypothetical protein